MIEIHRTGNLARVRQIAIHPRIFPQISDDFTSNPETWQPISNTAITYLLASDQTGDFGFGIFVPRTHVCWEGHFGFLPRSYGQLAQESLGQMFAWIWEHTTAQRIVGEIRRENRLAVQFAVRGGCEIYGINRRSFMKGGKLVDQLCLGISRPV